MEKYIQTKIEHIGVYLTDAPHVSPHSKGNSFWMTPKPFSYLPLLSHISIAQSADVRLCDGKMVDRDLITHHSHHSLIPLAGDILTRSKIDITTNDLYLGPVRLVFNFTGHPLTLTTPNGVPKFFHPLDPVHFGDLEGKLVIVYITTLNSIDSVHSQFGYTNYVKLLRDGMMSKTTKNCQELVDMYDFVLSCMTSYAPSPNEKNHDTIKVASVVEVDISYLLREEEKNVLILTRDHTQVSMCDPVRAPDHHNLYEELGVNQLVVDTIRANGISCFIVDNNDTIAERYYNFAGMVKEVPRIKSLDKIEGFYTVSIDNSQKLTMDSVVSLTEIDNLKYIYKNRESALKGADLREQYGEQLERLRHENATEMLTLKREHEREMRDIQANATRSSANTEQNKREAALDYEKALMDMRKEETQRKRDYEKLLADIKLEAEERKRNSEKMSHLFETNKIQMSNDSLYVKRDYEHAKYERDSVVETLKTVGAVAGLMAGGYALYSKFSK